MQVGIGELISALMSLARRAEDAELKFAVADALDALNVLFKAAV